MSRKNIFIAGFALSHFVLSSFLFLWTLSLSMARFDMDVWNPPTFRERILDRLSDILLFPMLPISRWLHLPGAVEGILFFANSLLWGMGAYYLVAFFRRSLTAR
ncbi:MAG: hypothetical protein H7145_01395 [Akkermansiaceae bacterium]|nr:hypothetical protein [Armatimonadota bacterium]